MLGDKRAYVDILLRLHEDIEVIGNYSKSLFRKKLSVGNFSLIQKLYFGGVKMKTNHWRESERVPDSRVCVKAE